LYAEKRLFINETLYSQLKTHRNLLKKHDDKNTTKESLFRIKIQYKQDH